DNPCKVFCGGLPATVDRERLRQHFVRYGVITDCIVKVDRTSGRSRGFGYVTFQTPAEAQAAIQGGVDGQGNTIDGKWVEVKPSTREGTGPSKFMQGGVARYNNMGGGGRGTGGWGMAPPPPQHYMAASPQPPHYGSGYGMHQNPAAAAGHPHHHQPAATGFGGSSNGLNPGNGNGATPSNGYTNDSPGAQQQQQNNGRYGPPGGVMSPAHGYHLLQQQQRT
ncbi:hypothetical protein FOZ63_013514, partial [Perkinsus olseni]